MPAETAKEKKAPSPARQAAYLSGTSAESRAALYLRAKGFRILQRRWRHAAGEIDLIAQRGSLLIFVEVKARARFDDAAYAVTPRQRARIGASAEAFLAAHPELSQCDMRFDVVLVAPRRLPRHIAAAFDLTP